MATLEGSDDVEVCRGAHVVVITAGVLPVSSLLTGYRGIDDVCLSVPCIVNRSGLESQLPIPMNPEEEAGVRASAGTIRKAIRSLGF